MPRGSEVVVMLTGGPRPDVIVNEKMPLAEPNDGSMHVVGVWPVIEAMVPDPVNAQVPVNNTCSEPLLVTEPVAVPVGLTGTVISQPEALPLMLQVPVKVPPFGNSDGSDGVTDSVSVPEPLHGLLTPSPQSRLPEPEIGPVKVVWAAPRHAKAATTQKPLSIRSIVIRWFILVSEFGRSLPRSCR